MSDSPLRIQDDRLSDLPPSAKLVYLIVRVNGRCTAAEIADASRLPYRTTSYALDRLTDAGIVSRTPSTEDARQSVYETTDDG